MFSFYTAIQHSMLLALLLAAPAHAEPQLDAKLDQLYDQVAAKFLQNPWFKNNSDPTIGLPANARGVPPLPEFQMTDRDLFKKFLKSYCVLLESPSAKLIKAPSRFGWVNFSQPSGERRLYVYDLHSQEIVDNMWTTHAWMSRYGLWWSLKDSGLDELAGYTRDPALSYIEKGLPAFFSNRSGSSESSTGMAIADTETYYSQEHQWTALRLTGIDGELNSRIRSRAVVLHEWNYNSDSMKWYGEAPYSEGCAMLPKEGFYRGDEHAEIAKIIMREVYGAPILFYHDRLDPMTNEKTYQDQLATYATLKPQLQENLGSLAAKFSLSADTRSRVETSLTKKLETELLPLIEETYRYFKTRSQFFGIEPKNPTSCMKALGI